MRWKSRHIEHPYLGPAPGDRFTELAPTDTRHGDVGEDAVYAGYAALEQANRLMAIVGLDHVLTQRTQHPHREEPDHLLILDHEHGLPGPHGLGKRVRAHPDASAIASVLVGGRVQPAMHLPIGIDSVVAVGREKCKALPRKVARQ
jgi:hypothetical protein